MVKNLRVLVHGYGEKKILVNLDRLHFGIFSTESPKLYYKTMQMIQLRANFKKDLKPYMNPGIFEDFMENLNKCRLEDCTLILGKDSSFKLGEKLTPPPPIIKK